MVKLRTPKVSGAMRELTNLRPVLRCKTRWSGAFLMVDRYFELKEFVRTLARRENDPYQLEDLELRPAAVASLKVLLSNMKKLHSVMLELQKPDETNLLTVRLMFDHTINTFPTMSHYIGSDSKIIHSPCFENAIVKLLKKVKFLIFICLYLIFQRNNNS